MKWSAPAMRMRGRPICPHAMVRYARCLCGGVPHAPPMRRCAALELGAVVQTASMDMLRMPSRMQLATLKCGATLVNSRLKALASHRVVARTDAASALPYIAAKPTICVAAFKICLARIGQAAVAASVRERTDALLAGAQDESEMSTSTVMHRQDLLRAGKHSLTATLGSVAMAVAVILSMLASPIIAAPETGLSRTLDGLTTYIGVIASETASEHLSAHPEAQMHGGKRAGKRFEHVVIAVYDARTNERVANAAVKAGVSDLGISSEEKAP